MKKTNEPSKKCRKYKSYVGKSEFEQLVVDECVHVVRDKYRLFTSVLPSSIVSQTWDIIMGTRRWQRWSRNTRGRGGVEFSGEGIIMS